MKPTDDSKEESMGVVGEWNCDGSDLCAELAGSHSTEFSRTYEGYPRSRVLLETPNLALIVDISPLVEGHLLIVPKKHYFNFASAILDFPHEASKVTNFARDWIRETYGLVALFEHGSSSNESGGACIVHAHVHVLPVAATELVAVMRRDELGLDTASDAASWTRVAGASRPYLLCSDGERTFVAFPQVRLRRQYLRSAAAEALGIPSPHWDWSLVIRKDLLRNTVRRYRSHHRTGDHI
ncbi:HIT domain-containing protein [Actinoplanes sp. NPDC026623]|uniref:HIT family protein n=1 Tax=Actinoplanes sp. NPDC026623 TaxID=3155610 RepID=UPI0033DB972D